MKDGYIPWLYILQWQKLNKEIYREFADQLNWKMIAICQTFDFNFVKEFRDRLEWGMVKLNDFLNKEDKKKFVKYLKGTDEN